MTASLPRFYAPVTFAFVSYFFHHARLLAFVAFVIWFASSSPNALGATLPDDFTETQFASGLTNATAMAFAPDGRLFVCQQGGQLRVVKNGVLLATPFVSLTVDPFGERGLLGLAFDPNFTTNNFVYVYYTATRRFAFSSPEVQ